MNVAREGPRTDVRDALDEQKARLALLEALVRTSDDALFSHDSDGRITSWSRSAERVFGYLEDEILGEESISLFPEHVQTELASLFETVMAGDEVDHFETEVRRKGGMPIPVSLSVCPVFDADGMPFASALRAQDITERRLAQATLAEIETTLRAREALAHAGGWLWDVGTGTVQWSDETYRIHGITPSGFEGTIEAHMALVHVDDQAGLRVAMEASISSARPFEREYRVIWPGGGMRWLYLRAEPTIGSAGTVVGFKGIVQDVTAGRQAP
jgi:PAS domain S-box-containing protein